MPYFEYGEKETDYLSSRDRILGAAIERVGRIKRVVIPDLFTALVRCIIDQQISRKAAETVWARFRSLSPVSPEAVAALNPQEIQACGLSYKKVDYIRGIAESVLTGQLDLETLSSLGNRDIIKILSSLSGIGVWTAEMILLLSMQRPDVVSWGDLGIRRGMAVLYDLDVLTKKDFGDYCRLYSPYGSTASLYLWHLSAAGI